MLTESGSVCPGRNLAEASVWFFVAIFLATFEIVPVQDEKGNDVVPEPAFINAITRFAALRFGLGNSDGRDSCQPAKAV